MRHRIVTYRVKPSDERENVAPVRAVFAELAQARPDGFRYAVFQFADSRQFVHLYTDEGDTSRALQKLPAFQAFADGAVGRHARPATVREAELIGDYGTFGDPDPPASPGGARPGQGQFGLEAGTHRPLAPASGARAQIAEAAPTPPARDEAALPRWHVEPTFLLGFGRAQKRHAG